jgi:hypothetical protein
MDDEMMVQKIEMALAEVGVVVVVQEEVVPVVDQYCPVAKNYDRRRMERCPKKRRLYFKPNNSWY